MAIGQPFVINSKGVRLGLTQSVHVNRILLGSVTEFVG